MKRLSEIEVYRLALRTVEREMDALAKSMKENPKLCKYVIAQYDEYEEQKKELVKAIVRLSERDKGNDGEAR